MAEYIKVAKVSDVPEGEVIGVDVGETRIAIANVGGSLYAFGAECTHMGGPLDEGFLEENLLQCPWHAGTFDVAKGEAVDAPASGTIPTFPVRVQGDDIEIEEPS
ncbi:MAG: non-heme iron oxygenase ferredoxin subunit [Chloroflexi bacterium]|nr:non-heme iron oxygenase ferredoxin subunit [Chloroflexota bacterium]